MTAIYPTIGERIQLRFAGYDFGHELAYPFLYDLEAGDRTEAVGFGGLPVDIEIEFVTATDADDKIQIEWSSDKNFTAFEIIPNCDFTVANKQPGTFLLVRNLEGGNKQFRVFNFTTTAVIRVFVQFKPNRV
jgi:hypothetical protein